jgi:hypothetical protein
MNPVTRLLPPSLGDDHQDRHPNAHDGKDDVEAKRDRHLRSRSQEIGHGGRYSGAESF